MITWYSFKIPQKRKPKHKGSAARRTVKYGSYVVCTKCGRPLTRVDFREVLFTDGHFGIGGRCPHCGTVFYEPVGVIDA